MPLKADQPKRESKSHALGWSCAISIALLVVFGFLQTYKSPVMELKAQWLWIAVLPILIVLVIGKYIGKFEAPGIKFEQFKTEPEMRLLLYAPPPMRSASSDTQDNRPDREALEHWTDEGGVEFAEQPDALERWTTHRDSEYKRTDRLFLVHVYEPSTRPKQKYDITIFLIRHVPGATPNQREGFSEIEKLELYFGPSWNNEIFTAPNNGGFIGIRTSAWGSFLATGRVNFKDGRTPLILHRYIDFEMAPKNTP